MKYRFAEMIWYETKAAAEQDRVAVLPLQPMKITVPISPLIRMSSSARASVNAP